MKNEIDDLLTAMFRSGKLNLKKNEPAAPSLDWEPAKNAARANQAMERVQGVNAAMAGSLEKSIEQLTKEANSDLNALEQQLKQDGVEAKKASNTGSPQEIDAAFLGAGREAAKEVLGQDPFLAALGVAFRRPFVVGTAQGQPLNKVLLMGGKATGRHSGLSIWAQGLSRRGVLKSPKLSKIDLSAYDVAGSEKLFVQDLYAALKSGAVGLIFENFENCHPSVLSMVSDLFLKGTAPLPGRYTEQKGMLVEIGGALVPGAVSSLSAEGKYLFLLTELSESKVADAFGMPFLSEFGDICETQPFSEEAVRLLADREIEKLCKLTKEKLGFTMTATPGAVTAMAEAYRPKEGVLSLQETSAALYRAVSEKKLKEGLASLNGTLEGKEGQLTYCYEAAGEQKEIAAEAEETGGAREAAVEAVRQELHEIVGLENVKKYILSLEDHFTIQQLRREKGLKAENPSMHMIFTGNPGTGKTTVARIVSRYLKAIGVLSGGQLIEVTRADLVGQYVGHTAPLTQKAIRSALGGVLFIDEAYSLFRGRDDSFGLEAIDTLVKGMEDHRDELLVILAGYSKEMEEFLTANSGLRSRFPNVIEFPDYTPQELLEITKSIVKGKGYRLDEQCDAPLLAYFEKMQREGDPRTNGNGRMARNKVEEAILNCSRRNVKAPEAERDLELLLPEDFAEQ